ncbi:MAG: hypothetical protein MRY21_02045 [Simkaniaceae bacterium]|nr:hypothetical protein [Simkaniaceae bacterium]
MRRYLLNWKLALALLGVTLFTTLILFRHSFIGSALELALKSYMPGKQGLKCSYEKFAFDDRHIRFKGLKLSTQEMDLEIEQIRIGFLFKLASFEFCPVIDVEHPVIRVNQVSSGGEGLFGKMARRLSLEVRRGELHLGDQAKAFFNFKGSEDPSCLGTFAIAEREEGLGRPNLTVTVSPFYQEILTHVDFIDIDLAWLGKWGALFGQLPMEITGGKMEGRALVSTLPKGGLNRFDLQVNVDQGRGVNEGGEFFARRLNLSSSYPVAIDKKFLSKEKWWNYLFIEAQVHEGSYCAEDLKIEAIEGTALIDATKRSSIDFKGRLESGGQVSDVVCRGRPWVNAQKLLELDFDFIPVDQPRSPAHATMVLKDLDALMELSVGFSNIDREHIKLLQKVIGREEIACHDGKMQGEVHLQFREGRLSHILLDDLSIEHLQLYSSISNATAFCSQIVTSAELEMEGESLKEIRNLKMNLRNGDLVFSSQGGRRYSMSDMRACIEMENGIFRESILQGRFLSANVKVEITGDRGCPEFHFYTLTEKDVLKSLVAEQLGREDLRIDFCDELYLEAHFAEDSKGWSLIGKILLDNEVSESQKIEYGCRLGQIERGESTAELIENVRKAIHGGWFRGKQLSSQVYQPIISLMEMQFQLIGNVDLLGTFDGKTCSFDFWSNHLAFRSEEIDIDMGIWQARSEKPYFIQGGICYEFDRDWFTVKMPVIDATCLQKELGLLFEHLNGSLEINGPHMVVSGLSGVSDGIQMEGMVELTFDGIDVETFKARVPNFHGSAEQALTFARRFPEAKDCHLPLDGLVESIDEGLWLDLNLIEKKEVPDWGISLALHEGSLAPYLNEVTTQLRWNSVEESIHFSEFRGALETHTGERIFLSSPQIEGYLGQYPYLNFDVRVENERYDLIRLCGESKCEGDSYFLQIDESLSQIYGEKLKQCSALFSKEFELSHLTINSSLPLEDAKAFGGILASLFEKDLPLLPDISGKVDLHATYDRSMDHLSIEANGPCLNLDGKELGAIDFSLMKEAMSWNLRSLQIGELVVQIDFEQEGSDFVISDGLIGYEGSYLSLGKGGFDWQSGDLEVTIDSMQLKPAELSSAFTKLPVDQNASFRGLGSLTVHTTGPLFAEAMLEVQSDLFASDGFHLCSGKPLELLFFPGEKVVLQNANFNLSKEPVEELSLTVNVKALELDLQSEAITGRAIGFELPPEMVHAFKNHPLCSSYLAKIEDFDPALLDSWENLIQGDFDLALNTRNDFLTFRLKDGHYFLFDHAWPLSNARFTYSENELDISLTTQIEKQTIDLSTQVQLGSTIRLQSTLKPREREEKLTLECSLTKDAGLTLHNIEGELFGISAAFFPKYQLRDEKLAILTGHLKIDPQQSRVLLPEKLQKKCEMLKSPFIIHGELVIDKHAPSESYFDGEIRGKNLHVADVIWEGILGHLFIKKNQLDIRNFRASDPAGLFILDELKVYREKNQWLINIPKLEINDFKPSNLTIENSRKKRNKPFKINSLILNDLKGELTDPTTLTGKGSMQFLNTDKREFTLLDIPLELISRLGLDMKLLVPIAGEIDFEVKENKIFLSELKNSHSEGKRSYFFFAKKRPSYITLDGKLNIDVNMKQYVLLKITQPFTLSIRGSVVAPEYGLK